MVFTCLPFELCHYGQDRHFPQGICIPPKVFLEVTQGAVTLGGYLTDHSVTDKTTTGFTAHFNSDHGTATGSADIAAPISFDWVAFGRIVVEEE